MNTELIFSWDNNKNHVDFSLYFASNQPRSNNNISATAFPFHLNLKQTLEEHLIICSILK